MDEQGLWQQELQRYREKGIAVVSCEEADAEATLLALVEEELPPPVDAFFHLWKQNSSDPWQILLQSAATLNPDALEDFTPTPSLEPLRSLLSYVSQMAILCWPPKTRSKFQQWGYLFQIKRLCSFRIHLRNLVL